MLLSGNDVTVAARADERLLAGLQVPIETVQASVALLFVDRSVEA
jgi:hypothetical protein